MKPKVLLLTASYGSGHVIAAAALEEVLKKEKIPVQTLDIVRIGGKTETQAAAVYEFLMKRGHSIWRIFHDRIIPIKKGMLIKGIYEKFYKKKFFKEIGAFSPDVIISTMDTCSLVASLYKQQRPEVKIYTVITDYVAHALWVWANMDGYFVPSEENVRFLVRHGIKTEKISITGIPLRSQFLQKIPKKKAREVLSIPQDRTIILISAGSYNSVPVEKIVKSVSGNLSVFVIILAGAQAQNVVAYAGILKEYGVVGKSVSYTENMELYMAAADLYISKAGGLTVAECLAVGLPALYMHNFPGHEEGNAEFAVEKGAARVEEGSSMEAILEELIHNPETLQDMSRNALKASAPHAGEEIVKRIMKEVNK